MNFITKGYICENVMPFIRKFENLIQIIPCIGGTPSNGVMQCSYRIFFLVLGWLSTNSAIFHCLGDAGKPKATLNIKHFDACQMDG